MSKMLIGSLLILMASSLALADPTPTPLTKDLVHQTFAQMQNIDWRQLSAADQIQFSISYHALKAVDANLQQYPAPVAEVTTTPAETPVIITVSSPANPYPDSVAVGIAIPTSATPTGRTGKKDNKKDKCITRCLKDNPYVSYRICDYDCD